MKMPARKIIHVDMDAFYASVEVRDNPALKGKPVVVGGPPEKRGVIAAASYEARRYGIRSAMPSARALQLCPQVVFLPPNFAQYREASHQIHEIFQRYTDLVEPLALDEAYLDVTENHLSIPSATQIAKEIKSAIYTKTALTASAGVAPNKFLAKIASDEKKPDGLFVIPPEKVTDFVATLSLGKIPGVGKVTLKMLNNQGFFTCKDMLKHSATELEKLFGSRGAFFYGIARGIDDRPVVSHRERKSVSIEDTFPEDQDNPDWLKDKLKQLANGLAQRLKKIDAKGRTLTLKLRRADFKVFTRSTTQPTPLSEAQEILPLALELFENSGMVGEKLRLLGLGISHLDEDPTPTPQLELPFSL